MEAIENPIRFQGQYYDTETGLYYNRNRYYYLVIGRFTSVDPIGLLGGTNNYEYAPNPTGWVDPLGLSSKDCGTQGTATVYWHDNRSPSNVFGHYTIETNVNGQTIHTHQLGAPGTETMITDDLGSLVPPSKSATFDLPDGVNAQDFQKSKIDILGEPYDTKTRSCVTHVGDVLRAGGVDVPTQPGAQLKYLKKCGL